jgi:hypothetical protein
VRRMGSCWAVVVACAAIGAGLAACSSAPVSSTQSYKDGYYFAQGQLNSGVEAGSNPMGGCSTLAIKAMVSGDSASQWETGCVAGFTGGTPPT